MSEQFQNKISKS